MKVPAFEDITPANVFDYEVSRNVIGWQLSYAGEDIATFITNEQAQAVIKMMDDEDIEDRAKPRWKITGVEFLKRKGQH